MCAAPTKSPRLVGKFIRDRREALNLSQRALGMLFTPAVTTQFISNIERGVTPLPPAHVPILASALQVSDHELMGLLEREFTAKLSGRLGIEQSADSNPLQISPSDYSFMQKLYNAYSHADSKTRHDFISICENMLNLPKQN